VERSLLAFLIDAYHEEKDKDGKIRVVLKLNPQLAPIKVAVLPLLKNNPDLVKLAKDIYENLKLSLNALVDYDEVGSIGRRYRRQDEVGTPWCLTIDHQSLKDKTVTIRDRDTMNQERIKVEEVEKLITERLK